MRAITWRQRLRYQFDRTMSRGTIALIGWLLLISAVLVIVVSLIVSVAGLAQDSDGAAVSFGQLLWMGLMRTMDAGTVGGDSGSPQFLAAMLVVTFGGVFIFSALIGVLNSGLEGRLDELRKGRSLVIEDNHTIILGWSSQVFSIISELVIANSNQRKSCITILADRDKVEMEDEIRSKLTSTGRTRIVCRSGSPVDMSDLDIVNPQSARAIIVLSPEGENPDAAVIKTMLALTNHPQRRTAPYHIIAEIRDAKNMEVARLVGRSEAELILVGDLIARLTVQVCRQSGLSVVYTELLDFDGDEIYFKEEPGLVGTSFGDALFAFDTSAPIGLRTAGGEILLNPPMDRLIAQGDKIIAISEDDDTIRLGGAAPAIDASALQSAAPRPPRPERTLILGWNRRVPTIVTELDAYVAPGSAVTIVADLPDMDAIIAELGVTRETVECRVGDTTDRTLLDTLDVPSYDHVIVLSYADTMEAQDADSQTLITMLHLRDIAEKTGRPILAGQRDARYSQPRPGRGDSRRRLHRQRQADRPDDVAGLGE